ncbi:hypothetical protein Tco_0660067 [Tanacetum coccineum]
MSMIAENVIATWPDNRPSMLEKILNGPFQYGTVKVPGTTTSSEQELNMISLTKRRFVNTKFVNNLQPEWSKFVTDVKLAKDMHESSLDQLNAYLRQHEVHANEVRMMREIFLDPFALFANFINTPPYYNNHQPQYNPSQYHQQLSPIAHQFYTSLPQPQPYEAPVLQQSYSAPVVHQTPMVHQQQSYQPPVVQQQSPAVFS